MSGKILYYSKYIGNPISRFQGSKTDLSFTWLRLLEYPYGIAIVNHTNLLKLLLSYLVNILKCSSNVIFFPQIRMGKFMKKLLDENNQCLKWREKNRFSDFHSISCSITYAHCIVYMVLWYVWLVVVLLHCICSIINYKSWIFYNIYLVHWKFLPLGMHLRFPSFKSFCYIFYTLSTFAWLIRTALAYWPLFYPVTNTSPREQSYSLNILDLYLGCYV